MHTPNSAEFAQTCSTNKMVEAYFDRLPCEILHSIALMLSFSSIIQLRCSSKFWYNLLTDPKFVDLHLADALEKPPGYLFSAPPKLWSRKKACYFVEQSGGHLNTPKIFEYSFDFSGREIWDSFQSSGGLMCAYSSQSCCFRIFNPHIAEEVQVPRDPKYKRWRFRRFIFSYSPSIKEYKILKLGELIENGQVCGGPIASEICTLGSNIWREIQNVPSCFLHDDIRCQGNPFWMQEYDLHFFDLVSEKFHVIPGPPGLDRVHLNYDRNTCYHFVGGILISMGDTVGYVHNYRLWVLKDKTQGTWINRYDFSIPPLHKSAKFIGTSENGHLFGYMCGLTVFSHDMGSTGFRITEMNLADADEEQSRRVAYIAAHVRSFVSPVRIMNMGKRLNHKRKRVLDTLKLDYDATEDDLFDRMYEFMEAYEKSDIKAKTYN